MTEPHLEPVPISALPAVLAVNPSTVIPGLQDGIMVGVTIANILSAVGGGYALSPWVTAHAYQANQIVVQNSNVYKALVTHTSGVFATDLAAGKWLILWDLASIVSAAQAAQVAAAASQAAAGVSEGNAAGSAATASTQAATATTQAGISTTKAAAALASQVAAAASETNAAASYDSFDDRYLGPKAADPTLDNDGAALLTGALYWNTVSSKFRVRTGVPSWVDLGAVTSFNTRTGAVVPAAGDYTAAQITNTPAGNIAAITAQAAINELDTEKAPLTKFPALTVDLTLAKFTGVAGDLQASGVSLTSDNALFDVTGLRSYRFILADDAAANFTLPSGASGIILAYVSTTALGVNAPAGLATFRVNSATAGTPLFTTDATNISFGVAALAGTTGTDTKLTWGNPGTGILYLENRTGASKTYAITILVW